MPVSVVSETSRLRVRLVEAIDDNGNEKLSTRTFGNVKPDVDNETLYNVMLDILGLQEKPVNSIFRVKEEELRG